VGDIAPKSYAWYDGESTGEELYGTAAVEVKKDNIPTQLSKLEPYLGNKVVLMGSYQYQHGEDKDEIVMKDAVILATFSKKYGSKNESSREIQIGGILKS